MLHSCVTHPLALCVALTLLLAQPTSAVDPPAAAATAGRAAAPSLFTPVADETVTASSTALNKPINGEIVTMSVPGAGEQNAVKTVSIDTKLLTSTPARLSLALPGANIVINRRRDNLGPSTSAGAASAAGSTTNSAVTTWVGEVVGARRATSSVVLVTAENGGVYGKIKYFDRKTQTERTFTIAPMITGGTDPAAAASLSDTVDAASLEGRFPNIDTSKHIVMEIKEPDYAARLAEAHEAHGEEFHKQQYLIQAELAARNKTKSASVYTDPSSAGDAGAQSIHETLANASLVVPAKDAQALAEAMAASAGEGASKDPADYLATAKTLFGSYASVGTTPVATSAPVATTGEGAAAAQPSATFDGRRRLLQTNVVHDLLVVYTPAAARHAGGDFAIQNTIRIAVSEANLMYANSRVPIRMRLLSIRAVTYSEGNDDGQRALADAALGRIPGLHDLRNSLGADMVQIWSMGSCGWGYMLPNDPNMLYSQVGHPCFEGRTTAHEFGHNQGCNHNIEDAGTSTGYAFGHRRCDLGPLGTSNSRNFMTVMSYPCRNSQGQMVFTPTSPLFSSPALSFNGVPAGSATTDCSRRLRETSAGIGNARPTVVNQVAPSRISTALNMKKCIDAPNLNLGTQVVIWDCNPSPNMLFELLPEGNLRWAGTSMCLDVRNGGTADGTRIQVHPCNRTPAQLWFYDHARRLHPHVAPTKCLDLANANTANGAFLQLFECGTTAQIWELGGLWSPSFLGASAVINQEIRSAANNLCLDIPNFNYNNLNQLMTWHCNGGANQKWQLTDRGQLRSTHNTNKCLDVGFDAAVGAPVYIHDCHNGPQQRWFSDNQGRLRSFVRPSTCLEIEGGQLAPGGRIRMWDCLDLPHFRWSIA